MIFDILVLDSLEMPHSKRVLLFLFNENEVNQSEIMNSLHINNSTLGKFLSVAHRNDLITIENKLKTTELNKRIHYKEIKLTDKGRQVAEQLINADLAAKGTLKKSFFSRTQLILMFLGKVGKANVSQIKDEISGSYDDLKELEEMKLITQKIEETNGKKENFTMLTEKGEEMFMQLEKCEDIMKR